eukprot:4260216-Pleurochrysis_carterae.AAC.1
MSRPAPHSLQIAASSNVDAETLQDLTEVTSTDSNHMLLANLEAALTPVQRYMCRFLEEVRRTPVRTALLLALH